MSNPLEFTILDEAADKRINDMANILYANAKPSEDSKQAIAEGN